MDDRGITLVLGGASSGKSEVAEGIAGAGGAAVTYVATGPPPGDDVAWAERVAAHRRRRPGRWRTVEVPQGGDLAAVVRVLEGSVLVDSLGTWVAGLPAFGAGGVGGRTGSDPAAALVDVLCARRDRRLRTVLVTEEVGMGVHPSTPVGGAFREALGGLNRRVADVADPVLLVIAGRVLPLGRGPAGGAPLGGPS